MSESEFVIVGGGPGGISAAIEAAKAGVDVTLLDENERLGGQIYRQLEQGFKVSDSKALGRDYEKGLQLLRQFSLLGDRIQYWNNTQVWGIFKDHTLALARNGTSSSLGFKKLLLATGAYDIPSPFPGGRFPVSSLQGAPKSWSRPNGFCRVKKYFLRAPVRCSSCLLSRSSRQGAGSKPFWRRGM